MDDGYETHGGSQAEQVKLKRLLGEQLRKDFDDLMELIDDANHENMTVTDWRKLTGAWMRRQETTEAFMTVLSEYERRSHTMLHPSDSRVWKDAFRIYVALDLNVALAQIYRDPFSWLAFMSGGSKRASTRRHVTPAEQLGIM